jgi:hypothetical protein
MYSARSGRRSRLPEEFLREREEGEGHERLFLWKDRLEYHFATSGDRNLALFATMISNGGTHIVFPKTPVSREQEDLQHKQIEWKAYNEVYKAGSRAESVRSKNNKVGPPEFTCSDSARLDDLDLQWKLCLEADYEREHGYRNSYGAAYYTILDTLDREFRCGLECSKEFAANHDAKDPAILFKLVMKSFDGNYAPHAMFVKNELLREFFSLKQHPIELSRDFLTRYTQLHEICKLHEVDLLPSEESHAHHFLAALDDFRFEYLRIDLRNKSLGRSEPLQCLLTRDGILHCAESYVGMDGQRLDTLGIEEADSGQDRKQRRNRSRKPRSGQKLINI